MKPHIHIWVTSTTACPIEKCKICGIKKIVTLIKITEVEL